jgi:hypothetical protein
MRITIVLALVASIGLHAQQPPLPVSDGQVIRLWSGAAPGALGNDDSDIPALTVYLPRVMNARTPAMIVCPGGGYRILASNHEGRQVANFLNSLGIAAFVLRYRLGPRYQHPIELGDAQRAIRMLRAQAAEWRLDPARIGILGFSAGGHLAMTASTWFDAGNPRADDIIERSGSRPDIAVLGYPVISMVEPWTHAGSKTNLLGQNPDPALAQRLSGERAVTKDTRCRLGERRSVAGALVDTARQLVADPWIHEVGLAPIVDLRTAVIGPRRVFSLRDDRQRASIAGESPLRVFRCAPIANCGPLDRVGINSLEGHLRG